MKAKTKTKAADSRRSASGTGGGPSKLMPLSDIELRILALIGPVAVGLPGVRIPLDLTLEDPTPVASTSLASIGGESQVMGHPQMEVEWLDEDPPPIEQITSEHIVPPQSPQPSPTQPPPPPPPPPRSPLPPSPLPHSADTAAPQQDRISERERLPRRRHIQDAQVPRWVRDIEEKRVAAEERLASSVERLASNAEEVVFNIGALQTMLDARLSAIQDAITSLQR